MTYQNNSISGPLTVARNDAAQIQRTLGELGLRNDASTTAVLYRQLEFVKTSLFNNVYPTLKYQTLIPVSSSSPAGTRTITYRTLDGLGRAKIIANYADDPPLVDVGATEVSVTVKDIGDAFMYSVQDLNNAVSGFQLDVLRALRARDAMERKLDEIAAIGDHNTGLKGLLNNTDVPLVAALDPGAGQTWLDVANQKTPTQILADLSLAVATIVGNTLETNAPDTILLPPAYFGHIAQTPMSTTNSTTILQSFLSNNPWIKNIDTWSYLATANAAGTGPRMVVYRRDPSMLQFELTHPIDQLPPQPRNYAFIVPLWASTAGVIWFYPLSALYMDGI